jgi:deoxyribonuclease-4
MLFGAHISAAGGVFNAPLNAYKHRAECYQFFSRSPRGGPAPELTPDIIKQFKINNQKYNYTRYYIHAPYYTNLASINNKIYYSSINILREELERGSLLGVRALMFHPGSAKDLTPAQGVRRVARALKMILKNYNGSCQLLLEISAGAGNVIGDSFEEIAQIIRLTETTQKLKNQLGVCFDTAHAFASGYDLRDEKSVKQTFNRFDKIIGLKRLALIHANDSLADFNSHRDRHAHLGQGKIGRVGFQAMVDYFKKRQPNMDFVVETPTDAGVTRDIKLLKNFRDKK